MAARVAVPIPLLVNPKITLEVGRAGDKIVLFGAMDPEQFDELLAAGAEIEDMEDGHDREKPDHWEG